MWQVAGRPRPRSDIVIIKYNYIIIAGSRDTAATYSVAAASSSDQTATSEISTAASSTECHRHSSQGRLLLRLIAIESGLISNLVVMSLIRLISIVVDSSSNA